MLYHILPPSVKARLPQNGTALEQFEEIRFRIGRPAVFCKGGKRLWLADKGGLVSGRQAVYCFTAQDMETFLASCSQYSLYAFSDQMAGGYLTIRGGHRVGFAGSLLTLKGEIRGFSEIGSANLRIAHEVKGCAEPVLQKLFSRGRYCNTLIVSPPGCGKTTLLRDLIRLLSDGSSFHEGLNVAVSDERGELAACYRGSPELDLGCNTDILDGGSKEQNLWLMLRSLNPRILAMDEIGSRREREILETACRWGVGLLASMHGLASDPEAHRQYGVFERFVEPRPESGGWTYRVYDREGRECQ